MNKVKQNTTKPSLQNTYPYLLVVGGILGLLSAVMLTIEKIELLKNPGQVLGCDLNPVVACGPVINTPQASAFSFPNPIIGLIGFSAIITIGMAILAGAKFKRWFWLGLQVGTLFGVFFVSWLQYQTLYSIGALCPYCMLVWLATIPIFWYTLLYNLREGNLFADKYQSTKAFMLRHHGDILLVWFLIIIGLILNRFWYYWSTLI